MGQMLLAFLLALPVVTAGFVLIFILKKKWLSALKKPIDGNISLGGKRIFGNNKTWLGVVIMGSASALTGGLIWILFEEFREVLNFTSLAGAIVGFGVIGIMYSIGELPNSFMKRRLDIAPGTLPENLHRRIFEVIDLVDGVVGVGLGYLIFFSVPVVIILWSMAMGTGIHFLAHNLMVKMGLKAK